MKKTALITGISGQDASFMAEFLLEKGYRVVGFLRRNAMRSLGNSKHLENLIDIEEGDITDFASVAKIIQKCRPQELYNLAAMSHVHTSFDQPLATFHINTDGVINILEAVKLLGYSTRIFHASTSELWGDSPPPQNEETMMRPRSPYAVAKLASHWMIKLYRESYNMYCCSGITNNHESEKRGPNFVTRKITIGVAQCLKDPNFKLKLGNLDAARDWGYAKDFVDAFWRMLQQEQPEDFVIATNEMHTVREFCKEAFEYVGLNWEEKIEVDRFFMRPSEVEALCGDYTTIKDKLGWEPTVKFKELVRLMVDHDCREAGLIQKGETAEKLHKEANEDTES